jgi:hypothetical protein
MNVSIPAASEVMLAATDGKDLHGLWQEFFPEQRFVLMIVAIAVGAGLVIALTGIIAGTISALHARNLQAEMKRDMLDRGMSADEIAKVLQAPEDAVSRAIGSWCKKW